MGFLQQNAFHKDDTFVPLEKQLKMMQIILYLNDRCLEIIRQVCGEAGAPYSLVPVDTLEKAKALPCVFNNYAVFYGGAFQTVNLLDAASLRRLLKR